MLRKLYLVTGVAVIALYVLTEANGWNLFGQGGRPAYSGSGGRQGSGYHSWGFGGFGGGK